MIAAAPLVEWRVGRIRLLLPSVIHLLAATGATESALGWPWAWLLVGCVFASAVDEYLRWFRERGLVHMLDLFPGGIAIDAHNFRARRAWLGPGWTAIWLTDTNRRRRLLYVMRDEVTDHDHAALRRHVKTFDFA
jgi:hypothetical protein